jgi:hypothetical protein
MMATNTTKAPRKTPQSLTLAQRLAHEHSMAVTQSTATAEILEEDGKRTDRLIYIGNEYSTKFCAFHGIDGSAEVQS